MCSIALEDMATRDMLADYGEQHSKIKASARPFNGVLPGITLLRAFDARQYKVTVRSDGRYAFEGQSYKSLSAIAKLITETQLSGPAFFGLKVPNAWTPLPNNLPQAGDGFYLHGALVLSIPEL